MEILLSYCRPRTLLRRARELHGQFAHINWALADQAIVSGSSFVTTVLIARFLGLEEFGRFALAWLAVFFAQNLQIALVLQPIMTIGAKQSEADRPAYFGAVTLQQVLLAVAVTLLVVCTVIVSQWFVPELGLNGLVLPLAFLVLVGQLADCLRPYFFVLNRGGVSVALSAVRYGLQLALLLVVFLLMDGDAALPAVFLAMSASALCAVGVGIYCLETLRFCPRTFFSVARRNWSFARWLLPNSVAMWARENFVFTATGALIGLAEVGALRAAQQIVYVVNIILFGFGNIVPIRASRAFETGGMDGLLDFIERFVMRYNALIGVILLAITLTSELLLTTIFGEKYAGYGYLIRGFALIMLVQLARTTVATVLRATERTAYEFYASISGFLLVAVASYPLVQLFGLAGAMLSMMLFDVALLLAVTIGLRNDSGAARNAGVSG